ncbi:MAG TPA: ABC transporter ATP-binding protein [Thermodesulfobacteriota bacterium]|nr:ABC transporter ATP-binding protein [Thermodesulfobacteriota bacterium]
MLKLESVRVFYGNVQALKGISIAVEDHELVALIGGNGAGKSTTLLTVSGLTRPRSGEISYRRQRIDHLPPFKILEMGIAHVPEGREIFPELTVLENLEMGAYRSPDEESSQGQKLKEMYGYFPVLEERKKQLGRTLSGGEQQMLAIARGLMSSPKLLLLDEPSLGLAPLVVDRLAEIILQLHEKGLGILLVEQNAQMALGMADRGYVLETGQIVLQGPGRDLLNDENVQKSYLGL